MKQIFGIASRFQPGRAKRPQRNRDYREFIKSHPCEICGQNWLVDPCHVGPHALSRKACDLTCIPLCRRHHDQYDADPKAFAERHGLDVYAVIARLNGEWVRRIG